MTIQIARRIFLMSSFAPAILLFLLVFLPLTNNSRLLTTLHWNKAASFMENWALYDISWIIILLLCLPGCIVWRVFPISRVVGRTVITVFVFEMVVSLLMTLAIEASQEPFGGLPWLSASLGLHRQEVTMGSTIYFLNDLSDPTGEARFWWRKAANANYTDGQLAIFHYWLFGPPDTAGDKSFIASEALSDIRKAADQGDSRALLDLACVYREGVGSIILRDKALADHWFSLAKVHGDLVYSLESWGHEPICNIMSISSHLEP